MPEFCEQTPSIGQVQKLSFLKLPKHIASGVSIEAVCFKVANKLPLLLDKLEPA
jgi:hypothetical protein